MFVSLQNSHVEILMFREVVLGVGLREGSTLMDEISAHVKEIPQSFQPHPPGEDTARSLEPGREPSPDHAGPPISGSQP